MKAFRISYDRSSMVRGLLLIALGVFIPLLVNEHGFAIYGTLGAALVNERPETVLFAATKLVLMNCIRAFPHYLGAFFINDSLAVYHNEKRRFIFNVGITFGVIWLVYKLIDLIYPFSYDFGIPAMLIVAFVLLLSYMDLFSVSWMNKTIILISLLMSIQWLDVVPVLSASGFGKGELSWDTKMIAEFLGFGNVLSWYSVAMGIAFLLCSVIQVQLLNKEHHLQMTTQKKRRVEKELSEAQINALRMRSFGEVQSLVHDLKTPLTTIQGLVTLSSMMEESEQIKGYMEKISASVENMSAIISEILYEDKKSILEVRSLMKSVLSQISIHIPGEMLVFTNQCADAYVYGNRIHLSRAIINLINNAYEALAGSGDLIRLRVYRRGGDVCIEVRDNGCGISSEFIQQIWRPGFSQNQSTGLGLSFTKQVVENHNGTIDIRSELSEYTCVTIRIKEEREHVAEKEYTYH